MVTIEERNASEVEQVLDQAVALEPIKSNQASEETDEEEPEAVEQTQNNSTEGEAIVIEL